MLLFNFSTPPYLARLLGLYLIMQLCACGTGSGNRITENQTARANQLVVVGKVVLNPGLASDEQTISKSFEEWRNVVTLITHHNAESLEDDEYDRQRDIIVPMDKTFFAQQPTGQLYVAKGLIHMAAGVFIGGSTPPRPVPLRGILKIPLVQGDEAVYIGTIRYTRGDFFSTLKVEVIDEYESTQREYQAKFSNDKKLEKRLAQVVQVVR